MRCHQPRLHVAACRLSRHVSTNSTTKATRTTDTGNNDIKDAEQAQTKEPKNTMAQLDEELRLKLEGHSGDGGAAGLELENGKAVAM